MKLTGIDEVQPSGMSAGSLPAQRHLSTKHAEQQLKSENVSKPITEAPISHGSIAILVRSDSNHAQGRFQKPGRGGHI